MFSWVRKQAKQLLWVNHAMFHLWLDWFQSVSCHPAGPLPTCCNTWGAEVTLRVDLVAMNKSKCLLTVELQLQSDLWKWSWGLRLELQDSAAW